VRTYAHEIVYPKRIIAMSFEFVQLATVRIRTFKVNPRDCTKLPHKCFIKVDETTIVGEDMRSTPNYWPMCTIFSHEGLRKSRRATRVWSAAAGMLTGFAVYLA
jgi:hypothetical protein